MIAKQQFKIGKDSIEKNYERNKYIIMKKTYIANEYVFIFGKYREIINNIVEANKSGMRFIPFSEWTEQLDTCMFVEEHDEGLNELISCLKNELEELATILHYVGKDKNGFLIKIQEKGTKLSNGDRCVFRIDVSDDSSLSTGELSEYLKQFPVKTKIKISSDSYDFEEVEGGFRLTSAWLDDDNSVVLYGN